MSSQEPSIPVDTEPQDAELNSSWALLILTTLLIITLLSSYLLQIKKIKIIHETVISIFTGMIVGFIIRFTDSHSIQSLVTFKYTYFFNLLLPPIILNSGYELKRQKFFDHFGYILTFAFFGTFVSSLVIAILIYLVVLTGIGGLNMSWVECWIFGSILSSTDPVTIISIFNQLKVEPSLYFIIFGESMLNDSVAIVLFESLHSMVGRELHFSDLIEGSFYFVSSFFGSLAIGVSSGLGAALLLKFTKLAEFPGTEACIITLIAYGTYFLSNAVHMSGIVSLLFCSIILRHYAYDNLSPKSQRSTKYMFGILAQLSENFIFIYLGVTLATKEGEKYSAVLIICTLFAILISRSASIFPISSTINFVVKRLKPYQMKPAIPFNYQVMLFWAGLRGAVSFALAMEVTSPNASLMRSTILIIVVITVAVLGGTTQFAMKRFDIKTGVTEDYDDDSDTEFDYTQFRTNESPEEHGNSHLSERASFSSTNLEEGADRDDNWFQNIDDTYLKPIFTKARNSMAVESTSNQAPTPPLLPSPSMFNNRASLEIISDEEDHI